MFGTIYLFQKVLRLDIFNGVGKGPKEDRRAFAAYVSIAACLVLFAGLMSGLTLGLLSLTNVELEVLRRSGTPKEQKQAKRIQPVLQRPHWLLVTLVLCNAIASEALPIFLDRLADPVTAVIISVTVVLIFGEIIPQAICSRYGLAVGAYSAWFVQILMGLTAIISWPISKILDKLLGTEERNMFRRAQLKALMDIHGLEEGLGGNLSADEISVIRGALDLSHKTALVCMTPLNKVFMLPSDAVLDKPTLLSVLDSGHSRIPVHKPGNRSEIVGQILVKELILVDMNASVRVSDITMRSLPFLRCDTNLYDMLRLFEAGRCHMAVLQSVPPPRASRDLTKSVIHREQMEEMLHIRVDPEIRVTAAGDSLDTPDEQDAFDDSEDEPEEDLEGDEPVVLGIITIEDVIEELLQQEIVDETDKYVDNNRSQRPTTSFLMKNLPKRLHSLVFAHQMRIGHLASLGKDKNLIVPQHRDLWEKRALLLDPSGFRELSPQDQLDSQGGRAAWLQARRSADAAQLRAQTAERPEGARFVRRISEPLRLPLISAFSDSSDDEGPAGGSDGRKESTSGSNSELRPASL
eukprot:jgi/Botrbrau1/15387/Bobra.43_2s0015.1